MTMSPEVTGGALQTVTGATALMEHGSSQRGTNQHQIRTSRLVPGLPPAATEADLEDFSVETETAPLQQMQLSKPGRLEALGAWGTFSVARGRPRHLGAIGWEA